MGRRRRRLAMLAGSSSSAFCRALVDRAVVAVAGCRRRFAGIIQSRSREAGPNVDADQLVVRADAIGHPQECHARLEQREAGSSPRGSRASTDARRPSAKAACSAVKKPAVIPRGQRPRAIFDGLSWCAKWEARVSISSQHAYRFADHGLDRRKRR
jgi:hypothetical protein